MHIDVHNLQRERLFQAEIDPKRPVPVLKPPQGGPDVHLRWEQAIDDQGFLRRCPVCACQELFVRRDFPQKLGLAIVCAAVVVSIILFGLNYVQTSLVVLLVIVIADAGIVHLLTGHCLVCYRCRSEFRDLPIRKDHPKWDLSTGEKHRVPPGGAASAGGETLAEASRENKP